MVATSMTLCHFSALSWQLFCRHLRAAIKTTTRPPVRHGAHPPPPSPRPPHPLLHLPRPSQKKSWQTSRAPSRRTIGASSRRSWPRAPSRRRHPRSTQSPLATQLGSAKRQQAQCLSCCRPSIHSGARPQRCRPQCRRALSRLRRCGILACMPTFCGCRQMCPNLAVH